MSKTGLAQGSVAEPVAESVADPLPLTQREAEFTERDIQPPQGEMFTSITRFKKINILFL
jgi:hypothetical protein